MLNNKLPTADIYYLGRHGIFDGDYITYFIPNYRYKVIIPSIAGTSEYSQLVDHLNYHGKYIYLVMQLNHHNDRDEKYSFDIDFYLGPSTSSLSLDGTEISIAFTEKQSISEIESANDIDHVTTLTLGTLSGNQYRLHLSAFNAYYESGGDVDGYSVYVNEYYGAKMVSTDWLEI